MYCSVWNTCINCVYKNITCDHRTYTHYRFVVNITTLCPSTFLDFNSLYVCLMLEKNLNLLCELNVMYSIPFSDIPVSSLSSFVLLLMLLITVILAPSFLSPSAIYSILVFPAVNLYG